MSRKADRLHKTDKNTFERVDSIENLSDISDSVLIDSSEDSSEEEILFNLDKMAEAEAIKLMAEAQKELLDKNAAIMGAIAEALVHQTEALQGQNNSIKAQTIVLIRQNELSRERRDAEIRKRTTPTSIFKGEDKEDPAHHLLKTIDWFKENQIEERDYVENFPHTLTSFAREWYDEQPEPITWEQMKTAFSAHYSVQGRNKIHLHERWRGFKFNPDTDNIITYIKNVKNTASLLDRSQ